MIESSSMYWKFSLFIFSSIRWMVFEYRFSFSIFFPLVFAVYGIESISPQIFLTVYLTQTNESRAFHRVSARAYTYAEQYGFSLIFYIPFALSVAIFACALCAWTSFRPYFPSMYIRQTKNDDDNLTNTFTISETIETILMRYCAIESYIEKSFYCRERKNSQKSNTF